MSAGTLSPWFDQIHFDNVGVPLAGGLIFSYLSGSSTPTPTFQDSDLLVPNTNPVVLNAAGRCTMFLAALSYKFILTNASGSVIKTQDGVGSVGLSNSGVNVIETFGGDASSPIVATSYPSGATFDKCHAGSGWWLLDSGSLPAGTYKLQGMLMGSLSATVTIALVNLTDGAPDTPIASISSASTTGALVTSSAITFATAGASKTYAIKGKVDQGNGFAWLCNVIKVA